MALHRGAQSASAQCSTNSVLAVVQLPPMAFHRHLKSVIILKLTSADGASPP